LQVIYTYCLRDEDDSILASFWLLAVNEKLTIWSSLPFSVFNFKKDKLMPKPLPFEQCEEVLNILHDIIEWVEENNYHKRFAFHHNVIERDRESFHFALDYRAIYHHPAIILCSQEINDYHFSRYKQEYEASKLFYPHRFMEQTRKTNRNQFEVFLNQGCEADKQWYVEHYRELNSFMISYDENMTSVFAFDSEGELLGLVFNKTRWMKC
jgi:hypothetical protein